MLLNYLNGMRKMDMWKGKSIMYKMVTKWIVNGKEDLYECVTCASDKKLAIKNLLAYTQGYVYSEYGLIPTQSEIFLHLEFFTKIV